MYRNIVYERKWVEKNIYIRAFSPSVLQTHNTLVKGGIREPQILIEKSQNLLVYRLRAEAEEVLTQILHIL